MYPALEKSRPQELSKVWAKREEAQGHPIPPVYRGETSFLAAARERVNSHLTHGVMRRYIRFYGKAVVICVWFFASYVLLLTISDSAVRLALCVSLGLAACAAGANIFHEAIHGSFSRSRKVNTIVSVLISTVLGASRYMWWYKHQVLHHRFTNIFRWDDDLETRGWLRLSHQQPWSSIYRYQHWYFPVLYGLATLEWAFIKDFVWYFTMRINPYQRIPKMSRTQHVEFWVSKCSNFALFIALPLFFASPLHVVLGLLCFHITFGLSLTLIFQVPHQVETATFPSPSGDPPVIKEEWAIHELRTTSNFAVHSRFLKFFAGGLNFHIEHHLFPRLNHSCYPEISESVRTTADEYGLPYHVYDTYLQILVSHYRFLRELGRPPSAEISHS